MFERMAYADLVNWKRSPTRKPLIMLGARQVGKTWLLREFGRTKFRQCHEINFEMRPELAEIFLPNLEPERILKRLSLALRREINTDTDLLFLDEIQQCPSALTSLKHFREHVPQLALCAAGSLLGLQPSPESFPVGQVDMLPIYPMTFVEFLQAKGLQALVATLSEGDPQDLALVHHTLFEELKEYFVTGGLPEIVASHVRLGTPSPQSREATRELQRTLINAHLADIAKHSGKVNALHVERVWRSTAVQLGQTIDHSVSRFKFKGVIPKVSAYERLAGAFDWLKKASLVLQIPICDHAETPISAFTKENRFKQYLFDTGLLGAMLSIPPETILSWDFGTYKGFFAENFVAQELTAYARGKEILAWAEGESEIEFLVESPRGPVPIEVKSAQRTRAQSLRVYRQKYRPNISIHISGKPSVKEHDEAERLEAKHALPLYALSRLWGLVNRA
jgi:predicted AAA+ superfamily ATPase